MSSTFIPANLSSQFVDLSERSVGDEGAAIIADRIIAGECPNLRSLNLTNCGIGDFGAACLAAAAARCPSLVAMCLYSNHISDAGLKQFLQNRTLTHLNLEANNLSDDFGPLSLRTALRHRLEHNSAVRAHRLAHGDFGPFPAFAHDHTHPTVAARSSPPRPSSPSAAPQSTSMSPLRALQPQADPRAGALRLRDGEDGACEGPFVRSTHRRDKDRRGDHEGMAYTPALDEFLSAQRGEVAVTGAGSGGVGGTHPLAQVGTLSGCDAAHDHYVRWRALHTPGWSFEGAEGGEAIDRPPPLWPSDALGASPRAAVSAAVEGGVPPEGRLRLQCPSRLCVTAGDTIRIPLTFSSGISTGPVEYVWYIDGKPLPPSVQSRSTTFTAVATLGHSGSYVCVASGVRGAAKSPPVSVEVIPLVVAASVRIRLCAVTDAERERVPPTRTHASATFGGCAQVLALEGESARGRTATRCAVAFGGEGKGGRLLPNDLLTVFVWHEAYNAIVAIPTRVRPPRAQLSEPAAGNGNGLIAGGNVSRAASRGGERGVEWVGAAPQPRSRFTFTECSDSEVILHGGRGAHGHVLSDMWVLAVSFDVPAQGSAAAPSQSAEGTLSFGPLRGTAATQPIPNADRSVEGGLHDPSLRSLPPGGHAVLAREAATVRSSSTIGGWRCRRPTGAQALVAMGGGAAAMAAATARFEWTSIATGSGHPTLPQPRHSHVATLYKGRLFVFGGEGAAEVGRLPLKDVAAYDLSLNAWGAVEPLGEGPQAGGAGCSATRCREQWLIFSPSGGGLYSFNLHRLTWTRIAGPKPKGSVFKASIDRFFSVDKSFLAPRTGTGAMRHYEELTRSAVGVTGALAASNPSVRAAATVGAHGSLLIARDGSAALLCGGLRWLDADRFLQTPAASVALPKVHVPHHVWLDSEVVGPEDDRFTCGAIPTRIGALVCRAAGVIPVAKLSGCDRVLMIGGTVAEMEKGSAMHTASLADTSIDESYEPILDALFVALDPGTSEGGVFEPVSFFLRKG